MAATLGLDWALDWLHRAGAVLAEQRMALIELDRVIGDADHGENMERGFTAALAKLEAAPPATPGAALKSVAMTLMSTVGGAAGPLYGTAFLRAATALGDAEELDDAALLAMLTAARDGIVARGKADPGDKTMIDAWTPAVDAAGAAVGQGPAAVLRAAADAAALGAEATEPLVARKGRASYLGERSAGHRDPGAQSTSFILRAAADAAGNA
ncbi:MULTISPECIES: dihydroxyacetone kinase subunit DhaL [Arthrobacter]|uniref:Dihydroxyacetone kinase subunit DhaL n=2 Tax=Arthrobacter TaxID=1663 RepID=A0ABU9KMJ3_9MICC|nr:dihydroxyacetone kinase subunit DhaL [Arthrobacter sp. YJM1]MDP5227009.1 dihydroxyacetone kinase subunit DhaL [Arthrobacter sp. YJM1]